jgi:hypothetical protein
MPLSVRPSIRRIVDAMADVPAFVTNSRLDVLYANALAQALYAEQYRDAARPVDSARFLFLDPRAWTFYADWDQTARDIVAALHGEAADTLTTARCRTSSGSCRPEARSSAPGGRAMTCGRTGRVGSASGISSSGS